MKFNIPRESLLAPLQQVIGVIDKRQTMPILSNVLLKLADGQLEFTGTDLEVELVSRAAVESSDSGRVTVPARKLLDLCRLLPERSALSVECKDERFALRCGKSRFSLSTMPAENYPEFDRGTPELELTIPVSALRTALDKTMFAMAVQDVRYYLNGLLLDLDRGSLRTVASDGHRLAVFEEHLDFDVGVARQLIIPRKGVQELARLLGDFDETLTLEVSPNTARIRHANLSFAVKLIEGRFPDIQRVMPRELVRQYGLAKDELRGALTRVAVLSTDKMKTISLTVTEDEELVLQSQNPEHEEAEERLAVAAEGGGIAVGFNAAYLLEALNHVDSEEVRLSFPETANACLVEDVEDTRFRFIVMPMRL